MAPADVDEWAGNSAELGIMSGKMAELPIKPVSEYLLNGPIPAEDLMYLDFLSTYLDQGIADSILAIHFMLEHVCIHGAPKWWEGTVTEFEQEFHERYHHLLNDVDLDSDYVWQAAQTEVIEGRLLPLPEDAPHEQIIEFLSHGKRRRDQSWAVELLLDMWVEAKGI